MEQKTFPTWGYKADGSAQIFNLKEGEDLPDDWADSPHDFTEQTEAAEETQPKKRSPGRPPKTPESTGL